MSSQFVGHRLSKIVNTPFYAFFMSGRLGLLTLFCRLPNRPLFQLEKYGNKFRVGKTSDFVHLHLCRERSRRKEKVCWVWFCCGTKRRKKHKKPEEGLTSTTMEQPSEGRGRDEVLDSMLDWELLVWQLSRAIFENRAGGR